MQDLLEQRGAIVTGGARGIGLAIAQTLGLLGARVLIVDNGAAIDGEPEDPAVTELAAMRVPGALAMAADVAAPGVAAEAVATAVREFGTLDIVVNNAAIVRPASILHAQRDDFERMLQSNLVGPFALLAAATPVMHEQVRAGRLPGSIVNVVSTAALYGTPGRAGYAAAKAGLAGLSRAVAIDLASTGITCNAVAPFAATRVTRAFEPADADQAQFKEHALQLPASHVANVVAWLVSPQAAGVTGQVIGVRGREVFVFSQSRPSATFFQPRLFDADEFAAGVGELRRDFTDLGSDLDAFNIDPVV